MEYFADGLNADDFSIPIRELDSLIVPAITLFEVFKRVRMQRGLGAALEAAAIMRRGTVVDLDGDLALEAADLSIELRLPMADSLILATARRFKATLWTQDADFEGIEGVELRPRGAAG